MKTSAARAIRARLLKFSTAFALLFLAVVALTAPLSSVDSRSVASQALAESNKTALAKVRVGAAFLSPAGETIEVLAADCVTPKTEFNLGETVCAKTDGVDLITTPGNYYMNWIDSSLNETNGGTITQNPQYFLFVPPTTDTWKATIGSVTPADSSIIGSPPLFTVSEGAAISTYDATCTTPQTTFTLGDTVCAKVSGVPPSFNRRFAWVDTVGNIRDTTTITTDPQTDTFLLPLTETETIDGQVIDNRGTWKANVITSRGSVILTGRFLVQATTPSTDLSIAKSLVGEQPKSGEDVKFSISVFNRGPNDAANVVITDMTPANTTFQSATSSDTGFTCTGTTTVTCTGAILKARDTVIVELVYTAGGVGSTITNTATVESDTEEVKEIDNSATDGPYTVAQGGGGGGDCLLICPANIRVTANTSQGGEDGAVVNYAEAEANGDCGAITYSHASGSFFPLGDTIVTATSETGGGSCSFRITVEEAGNTTISCPADQSGTANANCEANIFAGTANGTGTNVTVIGTRSDGKPMYDCDVNGTNCTRKASDAPFPAGTTTITWIAYSHSSPGPYADADDEEAKRTGSASCSQIIVIDDVTAPVITATDQTIAADGSCQATVPDYLNTVSDNCACASSDNSEICDDRSDFIYTQSPAPGTVVGLGQHQVTITANDRSSNNNGAGNETTKTITLTVADQTPPAIDCPDNIETTTDPGTCSAVVDPGTATATDNCDSSPTITASRSDSQPLNAPYPKGTTTITWRATDDAGNYSECSQTVTVTDDEAPVINFNTLAPSLWPPNHSYHSFNASDFVASVSDNCDSIPVSSVYVTKITSDEAENGNGDGNTSNDILIAADCKSFQLRSERAGNGNGRVYTIFFKVEDTSGNVATGTRTVVVRKNPNQVAIDSGPNYTVNSSCP